MAKAVCLNCGKVLESNHRHDYVRCGCENRTFLDGGDEYTKYGGVDLNKIKLIPPKKYIFQNELGREVNKLRYLGYWGTIYSYIFTKIGDKLLSDYNISITNKNLSEAGAKSIHERLMGYFKKNNLKVRRKYVGYLCDDKNLVGKVVEEEPVICIHGNGFFMIGGEIYARYDKEGKYEFPYKNNK